MLARRLGPATLAARPYVRRDLLRADRKIYKTYIMKDVEPATFHSPCSQTSETSIICAKFVVARVGISRPGLEIGNY